MEKQLHLNFIKTATTYRKKMAIYDQGTGNNYTYGKVLISTLILSRRLKGCDEKYIGVLLPTTAGAMIAILAILCAGKIPVLINYSTGAKKNCLFAQEKCKFKKIITSKKLLDKLGIEKIAGMELMEDMVSSISMTEKLIGLIQSYRPLSFIHIGRQQDVSCILFTSGSERHPKAVQLTHKNILANIESTVQSIYFSESDVFMSVLPLFHVFGLMTCFWVPFTFGCSVVTHPNPLEYQAIVTSVKKYLATVFIATPTFFYGYLQKSNLGDFKSLRMLIAGGDKLTDVVRNGYKQKHGLTIYEGYGATETSPVISLNIPNAIKDGSIGRPLPNVEVKIVDVETHKELPVGCEGKIWVKGDLVMKGYLGDKEKTQEVIHDGWYDTGDMGIIDNDGFVWHKGRLRRFVKIGGEMVSLVAIEGKLKESLADDCQCCVVEVPHPIKGAEIVATVTRPVDESFLLAELAKEFPPLAIPKRFLQMESLPIMGNGKIDFRGVADYVASLGEKNNNFRV